MYNTWTWLGLLALDYLLLLKRSTPQFSYCSQLTHWTGNEKMSRYEVR